MASPDDSLAGMSGSPSSMSLALAGGAPSSSNGYSSSNPNLASTTLLNSSAAGSQAHLGGSGSPPPNSVVPVGFEEGTLRSLCDLDCGFPLLMDRIKQSMASCRETSTFFKKRAQIEEEYGRAMQKLTRERMEGYSASEGKAGSFVTAFQALLRAHEMLAENRLRMGAQLHEASDALVELAREVEKSRKTAKELGTRLERNLLDSENATDKSKMRFDGAVEELERVLISKAGENAKDIANSPHEMTGMSQSSTGKRTLGKAIGKLKGGPKNPAQFQRMEEDSRAKMNNYSDAYRQQVLATQTIRQEYFNLQLPRMLKSMKESLDEIDLGTQFHLSRYAYFYESMLLNDALTVSPPQLVNPMSGPSIEEGPGLKSIAESIDNREDFKTFMQNYAVTFAASGQRVLRREGPPEEGFVRMANKGSAAPPNGGQSSPYLPSSNSPYPASQTTSFTANSFPQASTASQGMYFGVDLGLQMQRDGADVPRVLEKCAETIDMYGLDSVGIYRLSGTTSRVQRLKARLDANVDAVDLNSDDNLSDINDISGVLKLFFRELPEPLFTHELYHGFIDAAKIENARLRHIRLHERINELPDPNYATCKYFLGHLDRVRQHEANNSMSISNLAIVFGPTLLGPPPEEASSVLQDMQWQCKAIETILEHYAEIFVDAEEEQQQQQLSPTQTGVPVQSNESISPMTETSNQLSASPSSRTFMEQ